MSLTYSAKIVERTSQTVELSVVRSGCEGCMTGCESTTKMHLPAGIFKLASNTDPGADVEVTIFGRDQRNLLTHSLILPLLGFVLGSSLGSSLASYLSTIWYESSDVVVLLGALVGLFVGVRVCRGSGFEVIRTETPTEKTA